MSVGKTLSIIIKARDEASKVMDSVGKSMGDWKVKTAAAGAALTAFGATTGAALKSARNEAMAYGRSVVNIQRLTGLSAEEASKAAAVFDRLGMGQKQVGMVMKSLSTNIASNSAALKDMGIATTDASGKARSQMDVLRDVADYYAKADDKTRALANVTKVLGRGYQDLMPILSGGADALDKITASAERQGRVLSEDTLKQIKEFAKAQKDNEQAAKALEIQMGLLTLPFETFKAKALGGLLEMLNSLPAPMRNAVGGAIVLSQGLAQAVGPLLMALPALAQAPAALSSLSGVFAGIGTSIGSIGSAISSGLAGIVPAVGSAVAGIGSSLAGIGSAIAGATGLAAGALVALSGAVGFGIGTLLNKLKPVQAAQKSLGTWLGNMFYDATTAVSAAGSNLTQVVRGIVERVVGAFDGIKRVREVFASVVRAFQQMPEAIIGKLKELFSFVKPVIDGIVAQLKRLNPFHRQSPSLVDNVLAGTRVIADAYSSIGSISVARPAIPLPPTPSFATGSQRAEAQQQVVRVYLDGRELSRSIASIASATSRSGAR